MAQTTKIDLDAYLTKYESLKEKRTFYEEVWDLITQYVYPRRNAFDDKTEIRVKNIYDSTALSAHSLMVDAFTGYIISRASPWFRLTVHDYRLQDERPVKSWLNEAERGIYAELEQSNFYDAAATCIADASSIGTTILYVEEDEDIKALNFMPRHPKEAYIATNKHGKVDTVYRHFYMTGKQLLEEFGQKPFNSEQLKRLKEFPFEEYEVLHIVEPRILRDPKRIDSKNKPWLSLYILLDFSGTDGKALVLKESGYDEFPYVVWRFKVATSEEYGRSYVWDALPDIIRLNAIGKDLLQAGQIAVKPPMQYPAEMRFELPLVPNGMIPYTNPARTIKPILTGVQYPIAENIVMNLRNSIREQLKVDFFLLLSRIAQAKTEMTAREVIELAGEKAAVLGTVMGRINSEFLDPILQKTLILGIRAGRIPPPPKEYIRLIGQGLGIDYIGTMAQAQKRLQGTQGITEGLNQLLPLTQFYPDILDVIDSDKLAIALAERNGMPIDLIRPKAEIDKIRENRAKAMQMLQNAQMQGGQREQKGTVPQGVSGLAGLVGEPGGETGTPEAGSSLPEGF